MSTPPEDFTPPPEGGDTGDVMQAHSRIWRHVRDGVERYAERLANDGDELAELIQAARVELWRIDASRCDLTNPDDVTRLRGKLREAMSKEAKTSFHRRHARSDVVPPDIRKELGGEGEDMAEE